MKYMVVMEEGETGYDAYVPDLQGGIAAGEAGEEVLKPIRAAIEFHIEGHVEAGVTVPLLSPAGDMIEINAA